MIMSLYRNDIDLFFGLQRLIKLMLLNETNGEDSFHEQHKYFTNETTDDENRHQDRPLLQNATWEQPFSSELYSVANNICPACFKTVFQTQPKLMCTSSQGTYYYGHTNCVKNGFQFFLYDLRAQKITTPSPFIRKPHEIGCKEYYANISFEHPLGRHNFYRGNKKLFKNQNSLYFNIEEQEINDFQPNYIIISSLQFKCSLAMKPLFQSETEQCDFKFQVDLTNQGCGSHTMKISQQGASIYAQFTVISDLDKKIETVNKMNYKFKRHYQHEQFVIFNKLMIEFDSSEINLNPQSQKDLSKEGNEKAESDGSESSSQRISDSSPCKSYEQIEKIQEIVQDLEFINYIKTQAGSKEFQKKAEFFTTQEIDQIIIQVIPFLHQIVLHPYANYMFQSLLKVCSTYQRMRVICATQSMIPFLVCQQQGTFVFQQLVAQLTELEEYTVICQAIQTQFKQISLDNYGHHFLRRLFEKMPKQLVKMFVPTIQMNFVQLSTSKNGIFIVQSVLKSLSQIQKNNKENTYILKKFLDSLTLHTKQLIVDQFGNYLIQQAFQSIQLERLKGVTQYIITFFAEYSCQKFSSNVVLNCVKRFWRNQRNIYSNLKNSLDSKTIKSMYHNKEGNKILLEIMELNMELGLQDKIGSAIRGEQSSKFNNRRWVSITGKSKTAVGTNYTNFSQAHNSAKRKHYN